MSKKVVKNTFIVILKFYLFYTTLDGELKILVGFNKSFRAMLTSYTSQCSKFNHYFSLIL